MPLARVEGALTSTSLEKVQVFGPSLRDVADDGVVSRLDRRTARPRAAEMVVGRAMGAALASGCHRPLSADGSRSKTIARRVGEAAPGPDQLMLQPAILSRRKRMLALP